MHREFKEVYCASTVKITSKKKRETWIKEMTENKRKVDRSMRM